MIITLVGLQGLRLLKTAIAEVIFVTICHSNTDLFPQNRVLTKESFSYKIWLNPNTRTRASFYFFVLDNNLEFISGKEKPNLTVKGPYVFWADKMKVIEGISPDLKFITYKEKTVFSFDQELTGKLSLDEKFFLPNIPAIVTHSEGDFFFATNSLLITIGLV